MISYNTIQEMIDGGYTISLDCDKHHHRKLDLQKLGRWLGFDHSTLHKDLAHKLWCPVCDSRKVTLTISPPAPNPYPMR